MIINKNLKKELIDYLSTNDLEKVCVILTKMFKGHQLEEINNEIEKLNFPTKFYEMLNGLLNDTGNVYLKNTKLNNEDAFVQIQNIMKTLCYDNGLPLSGLNYPKENPTEENDFFNHYDREQDFWGFYNEFSIYEFVIKDNEIFMVLDLTINELKEILDKEYSGSSWEHDFD